ncbi:MAG: Transcriptional regulator, PaaX family [Candidatus Giovannonibacteria bacterium GW2011_GWA2_44_13b]|uniref:Transcriptional regulator, PaaX family n=1 Tax=Candidatus Giovannonibacteria bacterium GW2011_GWA2_44_13b TaxID=1618647 RepID=A0A0G1H202_9BACT|nr:MAG: Transcriptional regulator, PaaX family [Candidatus Giovannonibacteria bacterium GW2011_GWA2_44_13b]
MRKGEKIKEILTTLAAGTLATLEILDEIWPYTTKSRYSNKKRQFRANHNSIEMHKFYNLLDYLKKEKLVEKKTAGNGIFWKITSDGLNKLKVMKEQAINYDTENDGKLKIIVFDVPEKERRKRAWLREALSFLGFKILQQSVWIGKNKIPEQFLFDLRQKNLLPYIHIMEVSRSGTVRELT